MNSISKPNESSRTRLTYGRRQSFSDDGQRRSERTTFRIGRELSHSRFDSELTKDPSTYRQSPATPHYHGY
jgi:hypothetical protein